MAKISVIGAGTWGTALAILLHGNGNQVTIWSALPGEVEELNSTRVHRNLPKAKIPSEIEITGDLKSAMEERGSSGAGGAQRVRALHRPPHA